ncbi:MAG: hypothetical protein ACE5E8_10145 [Acidimicrobiia bacterium]
MVSKLAAGGRKDEELAQFDVDSFLERFRDRAAAVRERGVPPLEGEARRHFVAAAEQDHTDYMLVGSAAWEVEEGHLVLRIALSGS